jgi:two-component system, chemotaxis family, protein-glutamate methylesterase/glutaminase
VVLTGALDDRTAGVVEIARNGGGIVVQDPQDADVPEMPMSMLGVAPDAHTDDIEGIAEFLNEVFDVDDPDVLRFRCLGSDVTTRRKERRGSRRSAP